MNDIQIFNNEEFGADKNGRNGLSVTLVLFG